MPWRRSSKVNPLAFASALALFQSEIYRQRRSDFEREEAKGCLETPDFPEIWLGITDLAHARRAIRRSVVGEKVVTGVPSMSHAD